MSHRRSVGVVARRAFFFGALALGGPIGLAHVELNPVGIGAAIVTVVQTAVLYGAWTALAAGILVLVGAQAPRRLIPERLERFLQDRADGFVPITCFTAGLAVLVALFGRTYDETPPFDVETLAGMLLYAAALATLAVGLVALGAFVVEAIVRRVRERRLWVAGLATTYLVAGVLLAIATRPSALEEPPAIPEAAATEEEPHVILIGLDGLDPDLLEELIAAGELPTFARLVEGGTYGELETIPDANSSVIWASIYTGLDPAAHGIHDFYRIKLPFGPELYPVHRTFYKELADILSRIGLARRTAVSRLDLEWPPLWEVTDSMGRSTALVDGYFFSFPLRAPETEGSVSLAYGSDELARRLARGDATSDDAELFSQPRAVLHEISGDLRKLVDFEWQAFALQHILKTSGQPSFVNFYTHEPDALQHQEWRTLEPDLYPLAEPAAEEPIQELHRRFDDFLADLLERIDPATNLLIVSDHGHSPTIFHSFDTQHRWGPPGVFLGFGPAFREGYTLEGASIFDVLPTTLYLLDLPTPDDAAGIVLSQALESDFVQQRPSRTVASYRALHRLGSDVEDLDRYTEEQIDRLKQMGYL